MIGKKRQSGCERRIQRANQDTKHNSNSPDKPRSYRIVEKEEDKRNQNNERQLIETLWEFGTLQNIIADDEDPPDVAKFNQNLLYESFIC